MTTPMTQTPPAGRRTLTTLYAKGPEDLLAAVPVVLGFEPEDSLTMMTFDGDHRFHARLDMPRPRGLDDAVRALLVPARRHRVERAAFVLYTDDAALAARLARRLRVLFGRAGIEIVDCLRAHEGRWWPLGEVAATAADEQLEGHPYDAAAHPFRAQAVMAGYVTLGGRDELARAIAPDPERVAATSAALSGASPLGSAELEMLLARGAADGELAPAEVAALLLTLREPALRDRAWCGMSMEAAEAQVTLWSEIVRCSPEAECADAAAVLAFAAWLAGQGALAWCALDRCFAVAPAHSLGRLVATALQHATSPTLWEAVSSLGALEGTA